ncbi:apiosidase-like domain-containing protein [Dellaglioa sp. BT-FLS60]
MYELIFHGDYPNKSESAVDFYAEFSKEKNWDVVTKVKGFYKGSGTYSIRFWAPESGNWKYKTKGIIEESGTFFYSVPEDSHGMVTAVDTHFQYTDGTYFYPFGTTVYALVHQKKELIDETLSVLSTSGFNKLRFCVFPKDYEYNHNEPELFPFENTDGNWNFDKPCYAYWDALEDNIVALEKMGIESDLILFHPYDRWGFSKISKKNAIKYLDYVVRRLGAYPSLWWSIANEYDLMEYTEEEWQTFIDFVAINDPFGHLLSIHNGVKYWNYADNNITHCSLQIKDVDLTEQIGLKYKKPVMIDECCYEGNLRFEWGNISAFEMVNRFWKVIAQGGYCTHGETYASPDEILWWSKGGQLKGESAERIKFLRDIVEDFPNPLSPLNVQDEITKDKYDYYKMNAVPSDASDFLKVIVNAPWEEAVQVLNSSRVFHAHDEKNIFLFYYARHCQNKDELHLPTDQYYDIEVIDSWNMTKEVVLRHVTGIVNVPLPGKEGIAVIANSINYKSNIK